MSVSRPSTGSPAPPALVRSLDLPGSSGRLEALLNEGRAEAPCTALVCHPHPLGGGNLHNKVVYHAMKVLNDPAWGFGLPTLRFNFRGTDLSAGRHDGLAESADVRSALDWLEEHFQRPVLLAGFSFGASMALKACAEHSSPERIRALALLGLPLSNHFPELRNPSWLRLPQPKLFLSGDLDQFTPPQALEQAARLAAPQRTVILPGADHFFTGHLDALQQALAGWLKELSL